MRQIKFRAWDKESEQMFFSDDGRGFQFELSPMQGNGIRDLKGNDLVGVDFSEWMQFTGLTDKNGKEIYEGDVITCSAVQRETNDVIEEGSKIVVGYKNGYFYPFGYNCGWRSEVYIGEIIGNIYENPELMTN